MERFPESRIPGVTRFMDFVIVDSVGYYTPLGRNRDSSARFRSIRFTDLIAAEATRGNDTLLLLFLFIYRRKFREKQSFYSTIPFLQKKKSKINKLISREIRVQFIRIDRSQKREREKEFGWKKRRPWEISMRMVRREFSGR